MFVYTVRYYQEDQYGMEHGLQQKDFETMEKAITFYKEMLKNTRGLLAYTPIEIGKREVENNNIIEHLCFAEKTEYERQLREEEYQRWVKDKEWEEKRKKEQEKKQAKLNAMTQAEKDYQRARRNYMARHNEAEELRKKLAEIEQKEKYWKEEMDKLEKR